MSKSIRHVYHQEMGRLRKNLFFDDKTITSAQAVVHVTAGEVKEGPVTEIGGIPQKFVYHLGDADVWVSNISPHFNNHANDPGGVEFILHIGWEEPLDVAVTVTVEDATPVAIQN